MPSMVLDLLHSPVGRQLVASGVVLLLALVARAVVVRMVRKNERLDASARLRWHGHGRSLALALVALGLLFIWGSELRDLLVSLVVLASAIVIATKEVIMCLSGFVVRATSRSFEVGDRIEVGAIRGDVIAIGLLGTTILEIGPGHQRTGRTHVLPNSVFLTQAVANETFTGQYVLHTFTVPVPDRAGWREDEARLHAAAAHVCAEHSERARKQMDEVGTRYGLSSFDVRPRITVHPEGSGLTLRVRVPTPARERGRVEQEILRRFLERSEPAPVAEVDEHAEGEGGHQA